MELGMLQELLIVIALILANGIFSGAEIAIVAIRASRVQELADEGSAVGVALRKLRANPESFLSTVQIGITVVSATAAAVGGTAFAADLAPWIARVPALASRAEAISLALVVGLISYLSIVLGELVPKSLALRGAEGYARVVARPLLGLAWLLRPAVVVLTRSSNLFLKIFGDHTSFTESRLSLEELRGLVAEASEGGAVPEEAGAIASRALSFAELRAVDVMVHRRFVVGLPTTATSEQIRNTMLEVGHQRTPIYRGSLDQVVGYISWRDVLRELWEERPIQLEALMRPCTFVPQSVPAPELLESMRSQRIPMAIVVDEHGGTAGIVTLEDLLEELVGEIVSEHDTSATDQIRHNADGSLLVPGTMPIRDVNRELELELDEPEGWTTISGLCIELAGGHMPKVGEHFTTSNGMRLEIMDATPRRVRSVRIVPAPDSSGEA